MSLHILNVDVSFSIVKNNNGFNIEFISNNNELLINMQPFYSEKYARKPSTTACSTMWRCN